MAFHHPPFRSCRCRSPGAARTDTQQRHCQCQRAVVVLRGFSCSVDCEQRSTRCCRRCRPATRSASAASSQHPGPGRSQPAAAFATLVAGRRCLAAICRRDDAQQVHFAGKRQPTRVCHSNSNHFSACSFWDAPHALGRGSVYTRTFCPPSPSASAPAQKAPFAPSAGEIQHPCSDACSSDEPATGAPSNHLPQIPSSVGDVGSVDFISVQYRQQPIPASDH